MIEEFFQYICTNAQYAPYVFVGLLMLAGLNVPISEDLILITAGALVSRCIPDQYLHTYLWIFFGSWISAWEAYWIGRIFGPKLYNIRWFSHILTPKKIQRLHYYYEKFGTLTFIVGRFFPGGVRNGLFLSAGLGNMPFLTFIARDFVGALISTSVLFYIGYIFGMNYEVIVDYVLKYDRIATLVVVFLIIAFCLRIWWKVRKKNDNAS